MAIQQRTSNDIARLHENRRKVLEPLKALQRAHMETNGKPDPELANKITDLNQAFFDTIRGLRSGNGQTSFSKQSTGFDDVRTASQVNVLPKGKARTKPKRTLCELEEGRVNPARLWNRLLEGEF